MMLLLLLTFLSNACPRTEIINLSNEPWNNIDQSNYEVALKRCPKLYEKSPCLKKFVKVKRQTYRATCGKP